MMVATRPPPRSSPRSRPERGDQRHQLVAIDHLALVVGDDDPVGVAIERDADVGAQFLAPWRTWLPDGWSRSRH